MLIRVGRLFVPRLVAMVIGILPFARPAAAWEGANALTGSSVEIERGETILHGHAIKYYDYGAGKYRSLNVDRVRRYGTSVEVEGTDGGGDLVTLEMDMRGN